MFEIKRKDGLARLGEFTTPHGTVETPAIMPVINPNRELVPVKKLEKEFGTQVLITNSYILYKDQELKDKSLDRGIHDLLGFQGSIMTDSGTFQAHVYGDIDVEAEEILEFQRNIGSDVITILDEFTEPDDSRETAEEKVQKTIERAEHALRSKEDQISLTALPIQGSIYLDLRKRCGKSMGEIKGDLYPIGGVVPLMEDYRFHELAEVIIASKKGLGPRGPVHLFGAGHPMLYSLAVLLGCDLFDSSSYAKYAKRGDMMYPEGTKNIEDIDHLGCECPVCSSYDAEEIRESYKKNDIELLAEHNLWTCFREMNKIKQSIKEGSLWEMVERRVRSHPKLLETLKVLNQEYRFLERFEPRSRRRASLYTGQESIYRPTFKRIKRWILNDYIPPKKGPTVYFEPDQSKKPYSRFFREEIDMIEDYDANLLVSTQIGPVPFEMDEIYPIAQSVFPSHPANIFSLRHYKRKKKIDELIRWEGKSTLDILSKSKGPNFDEMKIKATADYQFGEGAGSALTDGTLKYVKNNKGRIKNVKLDQNHILSVRHYDGFFTLKKTGAEILLNHFSPPDLRIEVTEESAEFNRDGKSVFSKFVTHMSSDLRHGDEAIVVTENDELVATARVLLIKDEVKVFDRGLAAGVRVGFNLNENTST
ncbi:MAG: tRNA guanosine(15) transglycosylase TgtA [Candidatus Thermoplasmatota archaeon]|nr:tRNA guanosine(15) transglycosylase TgtA [Candidatus Thermoplasmatota archaeon]MBS3789551.1 tRNA guanosine(15) transglycosylase TgtA [Candidatus Thermoplasmatota archaeon]